MLKTIYLMQTRHNCKWVITPLLKCYTLMSSCFGLVPVHLAKAIEWVLAKTLPGDHFTKQLWAHYSNLVKMHFALIWILTIRSGHNFAHVTTAELSVHVQNCDPIGLLFIKWKQYAFSQDLNYELIFLCETDPRPQWFISCSQAMSWIIKHYMRH